MIALRIQGERERTVRQRKVSSSFPHPCFDQALVKDKKIQLLIDVIPLEPATKLGLGRKLRDTRQGKVLDITQWKEIALEGEVAVQILIRRIFIRPRRRALSCPPLQFECFFLEL